MSSRCGQAALLAWLCCTVLGCATSESTDSTPTFVRDVAPLLHRECAGCHHRGGVGPFELVAYEDVREHAGEIARVVASRYMPPWLPQETSAPFSGTRRLDETQIAMLLSWIESDTPRGSGDPPSAPEYPDGWQLARPDRVLAMPAPYTLRAGGTDEYRNFVIRSPVDRTIWVGAFEFDPGNLRVVHHARILVDPTTSSRRRDDAEKDPGFGGMSAGDAIPPDGMILGWAPGKLPSRQENTVWRLDPGTDVVVQLHMVPSGKPESVLARIALHEVDGPAENPAYSILLGSREIDIPVGATAHAVGDRYVLPVDVDVVGLYPHAHYLGKTMRLRAETAAGTSRDLLRIDDWDFNWQDDYWFETPVSLSAGTTLVMEFTYDNTAENIRNPNIPPRTVVYGARSVDEMAELLVQVVPHSSADRALLDIDHSRQQVRSATAWRESEHRKSPGNAENLAAIATNYVHLGEYSRALTFMRMALIADDQNADIRANFGWIFERMGNPNGAIRHYAKALKLDERHVESLANLGRLLRDHAGQAGAAIALHERLVKLRPDEAGAHAQLAETLRRVGRPDDALAEYLEATRLNPEHAVALAAGAWLFATHPIQSHRDSQRALMMATAAVELTAGVEVFPLAVRAAAEAADGQFEAAERSINQAIEAAEANAGGELRRQRALYRARRSFEPPPG